VWRGAKPETRRGARCGRLGRRPAFRDAGSVEPRSLWAPVGAGWDVTLGQRFDGFAGLSLLGVGVGEGGALRVTANFCAAWDARRVSAMLDRAAILITSLA
jgi:hypothetical protein